MSDTKPWALSPLIATMPYFMHERIDDIRASPLLEDGRSKSIDHSFPPSQSIGEDTSQLQFAIASSNSRGSTDSSFSSSASSLASSSSSLSSSSTKHSSFSASMKYSLNKPLEKAHLKKKKSTHSLDLRTAHDRRSYFSVPQHRKEIIFGPEACHVI